MIKYKITDEILSRAKSEVKDFSFSKQPLDSNLSKADAYVYGRIGELLFEKYLDSRGISFEDHSKVSMEYDYLVDGVRVDVKTTRRYVPPENYMDCSVLDRAKNHNSDYYFFVSLYMDKKTEEYLNGYLLGSLSNNEFWDRPKEYKRGDKASNGLVFAEHKWSKTISQLNGVFL